jgi:hypothetical protein
MKETLLGVLGFILQPNLQIPVLSQFQLSSLEDAIAVGVSLSLGTANAPLPPTSHRSCEADAVRKIVRMTLDPRLLQEVGDLSSSFSICKVQYLAVCSIHNHRTIDIVLNLGNLTVGVSIRSTVKLPSDLLR